MVSYVILCYPIPLHGIACYCVVGFGARAVSCKTPTYLFHLFFYDELYLKGENDPNGREKEGEECPGVQPTKAHNHDHVSFCKIVK